jgi:cbb3-type cytochrome oxidase subunit 3
MSDTAAMTAIAMVLGAVVFGVLSYKYGAESRHEFDERSNLS